MMMAVFWVVATKFIVPEIPAIRRPDDRDSKHL
jgi:hypothetical protein